MARWQRSRKRGELVAYPRLRAVRQPARQRDDLPGVRLHIMDPQASGPQPPKRIVVNSKVSRNVIDVWPLPARLSWAHARRAVTAMNLVYFPCLDDDVASFTTSRAEGCLWRAQTLIVRKRG
jgi:hypothetical protein